MNTQEAVKGRWAEIFAYYGLSEITGKKIFGVNAPFVSVKISFGLMIGTIPVVLFVCVTLAMAGNFFS